jgi:hypothetical protein
MKCCEEELAACEAKRAESVDSLLLDRSCYILKQVQLWETREHDDLQPSLSPESYIHNLDLRTSRLEDNPDESNYGYNSWVIVFEKGKGGVTIDHPLCHGHFPNQKISIQQLLYNKSQTPLNRAENKIHIRYFHLPANNMKWVEVRARTYF